MPCPKQLWITGRVCPHRKPKPEGSGLPIWQPWLNAKSAPKIIILDADFENIKIEMSNKELSNADIEKALKAEPRYKEIKPFWENSRFGLMLNIKK